MRPAALIASGSAPLARRVDNMGDLAQAIVSLASAARGRREARKDLREACAVVGRAIAQHLRNGDTARVGMCDAAALAFLATCEPGSDGGGPVSYDVRD